jgi:hypothetical protein
MAKKKGQSASESDSALNLGVTIFTIVFTPGTFIGL